MAVQNFVLELIETLLKDEELSLAEGDIRFYDKGTIAVEDAELDGHIRWQNARDFNEDTNVVRSDILSVQIVSQYGMEYVNSCVQGPSTGRGIFPDGITANWSSWNPKGFGVTCWKRLPRKHILLS